MSVGATGTAGNLPGAGSASEIAHAEAVAAPAAPAAPADLADPKHLERDVRFMERGMVAWRKADGELFVGGPEADDAKQGRIGDCYFVASIAALAQRSPERIRNLVRENPDGTFSVTLHKREGDALVKTEVRVDRDLVARKEGGALYASSADAGELWPAVVEKAYAQMTGGYDAIGYGGIAGDALEAITGEKAVTESCGDRTPQEEIMRKLCFLTKTDPGEMLKTLEKRTDNIDSTWRFLKDAGAKGDPLVASTYPEGDCVGDGLYPMHAYTVLGVEERGGEKFVKLRNPAPYTDDLKDPDIAAEAAAIPELKAFADLLTNKGIKLEDLKYGEFEVPFDAFRRSFHTVYRAPISA